MFSEFSSSSLGSFMYSTAPDLNLTMINNSFESKSSIWTDPEPDLSVSEQGGSFYIANAANVV